MFLASFFYLLLSLGLVDKSLCFNLSVDLLTVFKPILVCIFFLCPLELMENVGGSLVDHFVLYSFIILLYHCVQR